MWNPFVHFPFSTKYRITNFVLRIKQDSILVGCLLIAEEYSYPLDTLAPHIPYPQYPAPWKGPGTRDILSPPCGQIDTCENITHPCGR